MLPMIKPIVKLLHLEYEVYASEFSYRYQLLYPKFLHRAVSVIMRMYVPRWSWPFLEIIIQRTYPNYRTQL